MTSPGTATTAPPLLRRRDDRVLKGVCAAVGRSTGTDPVLWRVVVGVLVLFGGTGIALYVAGWLLLPEAGTDGSLAERFLRRHAHSRLGAVLLVLGAGLVLLVALGDHHGVVPLLTAAVLAYVVLRGDPRSLRVATREEAMAAAAPTVAGPTAAAPQPEPWSGSGWPPLPRPALRPRSPLGLLTLSTALVLTGVLLALHAAGVAGITLGRLLAADLAVVAVGLLIGAVWSRARWLAAPAVLLAIALAATASARVPVALSAGTRTWVVLHGGDRRLGVGQGVLDLRRLSPTAAPTLTPTLTATDVRVEQGAGELQVHLPADLHVELTAVVAAGEVVLPGEPHLDGTGLRVVRTYGPPDAPLVRVRTAVGAGQVEVLRDAS